jgi:hypothetical protein
MAKINIRLDDDNPDNGLVQMEGKGQDLFHLLCIIVDDLPQDLILMLYYLSYRKAFGKSPNEDILTTIEDETLNQKLKDLFNQE